MLRLDMSTGFPLQRRPTPVHSIGHGRQGRYNIANTASPPHVLILHRSDPRFLRRMPTYDEASVVPLAVGSIT
jgi:hypothetical protein